MKACHWLLGFSKGLTSRAATTAQYFAAFKFLNFKLVRTKKFCEGQLGIVLVWEKVLAPPWLFSAKNLMKTNGWELEKWSRAVKKKQNKKFQASLILCLSRNNIDEVFTWGRIKVSLFRNGVGRNSWVVLALLNRASVNKVKKMSTPHFPGHRMLITRQHWSWRK